MYGDRDRYGGGGDGYVGAWDGHEDKWDGGGDRDGNRKLSRAASDDRIWQRVPRTRGLNRNTRDAINAINTAL